MARVPRSAAPAEPPRRTIRRRVRLRVPVPLVDWTRVALAAFLGAAATLAPEDWQRAAAGTVVVLVAYRVGWWDGRRDHALDLLGARSDAGFARRAQSSSPGPEARLPSDA